MKDNTTEFLAEVDEGREFEDWEFDYTNHVVDEFLEETIIPLMDHFDFANSDENYVPGVASFTLFTRLIETLSLNGWTVDELKQAVEDFSAMAGAEVLH